MMAILLATKVWKRLFRLLIYFSTEVLSVQDTDLSIWISTMPAKSLGTPLQILSCFAISPSPPQNNVVLWSKNRHDRTIRDSAGMLGQ